LNRRLQEATGTELLQAVITHQLKQALVVVEWATHTATSHTIADKAAPSWRARACSVATSTTPPCSPLRVDTTHQTGRRV
jgi:hypothetical protein